MKHFLIGLTIFISGFSSAQTQSFISELQACRAETNSTARLACYDNLPLTSAPQQAVKKAQNQLASSKSAPAVTHKAKQAPQPEASRENQVKNFGLDKVIEPKDKVEKIYVNKEVILSGGAINSPQLLMLSGVGPSEHLKDKGIDVVHNLEGVGRNLQDHLETYVQQECKTSDTLYSYVNKLNMLRIGIQWFLSRTGPCSTSFLEAGGFCKSSPEREYPNIQFHFFPAFVVDHGLVDPDRHGYQLHASPNHPKSRGHITLNSSNPYDYPKIQFNYLEHEDDLKQTIECIHVARKILGQNSLKPFAGKETGPGEHVQTDELFEEYIRSKAETAYHPSCTLKMGTDNKAVVDEKLKVHGLDNLRVVDASVMPEITSGNLNAPTIMIAERASDFILSS